MPAGMKTRIIINKNVTDDSDIVIKHVETATRTCTFDGKDYITGYNTLDYKERGDEPNQRMCVENNATLAVINCMDEMYK